MDLSNKQVLDPCCGSRMFWFDKANPVAVFGDIRSESHILCDGRRLDVRPDIQMDFTDIPFDDASFRLVVFDPPHLNVVGNGYMSKKIRQVNWRLAWHVATGFCRVSAGFDAGRCADF